MQAQARLVKDFSVFDFNHVPGKPLMREECKYLIDEMMRFGLTGIPSHQAVIGSKGCGKTLALKHLQRVMQDQAELQMVYANCREHNTSFKILAHLLGVKARGSSLSELFQRLCQNYPQKTIIVLDEIDLMSPKDKTREILYLLSRSEKPYMVIMLSNNYQVLKDLDAATRSSLQPATVYFKNYDAPQILEILRERARQGLHQWQEEKLAQISALTARKTNGDARVAIKTLYHAVTEPQMAVEECFERARKDILTDMIHDLSDPSLLILNATATCRSAFAKDIYKKYCQISLSHNEPPFSYVYFYSYLSHFQSMGLVALISTKVGRTYANRVMLTFEEAMLEPVIHGRLGRA